MLKNDEFRVFEDEDIYLDIDKTQLGAGKCEGCEHTGKEVVQGRQ